MSAATEIYRNINKLLSYVRTAKSANPFALTKNLQITLVNYDALMYNIAIELLKHVIF